MESAEISPKGLVKKHEFVRIMIQSLYSLGYERSASCLESESGISYKSVEFEILKSQVLNGDWDGCVATLNGIPDFMDDSRATALYLVFKQRLFEYLNLDKDSLALDVLRKQVPQLRVGKEKIQKLALSIVASENMKSGKVDENGVLDLRERLLAELERLVPPGLVIPEKRLENLVEFAVFSQINSCKYHNSEESVSLYKDHLCCRDQIPTEAIQVLYGHENEVWFVVFSNNGNYLASSSKDCTAIIWKVGDDNKLRLQHTLRGHENSVSFLSWSPDDTKLLTCGNAEVLKLWDVRTGRCRKTFGGDSFKVSACAWTPCSKWILCGSSEPEKGIVMWDCNGNEVKAWRGTRMPKVLDLAVTPDGNHLISILSEKVIRILNLKTNAEVPIIEEHPITSLSVSSDSKFLIVNLNSQEIHMWDIARKLLRPIAYMGHRQSKFVIRSCFGGWNSSFIASGSEDSRVYIWHRMQSKPLAVLDGHSMTVNCVSWNPKRLRMLASASDDHTIHIWGPKTQH